MKLAPPQSYMDNAILSATLVQAKAGRRDRSQLLARTEFPKLLDSIVVHGIQLQGPLIVLDREFSQILDYVSLPSTHHVRCRGDT